MFTLNEDQQKSATFYMAELKLYAIIQCNTPDK